MLVPPGVALLDWFILLACTLSLFISDLFLITLFTFSRCHGTSSPLKCEECRRASWETQSRELGIGIVSYSPVGRGFFAGYKPHGATEADFRKVHERFSGENLEKNEKLRQRVLEIAEKKKCSSNQLALAWVHHMGKEVVPIPGTTKRKTLDSNVDALRVRLTDEEISKLEAAVPVSDVAGERYNAGHLHSTWRYAESPPLSSWKLQSIRFNRSLSFNQSVSCAVVVYLSEAPFSYHCIDHHILGMT